MKRSITLVFNTKNSVVHSNISLQADHHVDLAYRLVEAGIYGSMAKKHWSFAIIEDRTILSMLSMYKKHERPHPSNGSVLVQYVPRVPANAVRDSYERLLLTLETLADANPSGQLVEYRNDSPEAARPAPQGVDVDPDNARASDAEVGAHVRAAIQAAVVGDLPMPELGVGKDGNPTILEWEAIPIGDVLEDVASDQPTSQGGLTRESQEGQ